MNLEEKHVNQILKPTYERGTLDKAWSEKAQDKYQTCMNTWRWEELPNFNFKNNYQNKPDGKIDGSILEVGSASGAAYKMMYDEGVVSDETQYEGFDISEKGNAFCRENYPNANWSKVDLSLHEFQNDYDYSFERIAVHHMENPLVVFNNMLRVTKKSMSTTFVSCIDGCTISDLSLSRYRHGDGDLVYFNIINIFEVMEIMLANGFNHIDLVYLGVHEKIDHDPLAHQYLSPEINVDKRMVGRTTLIATKTGGEVELNLVNKRDYGNNPTEVQKQTIIHRKYIEHRLEKMANREYGILYKSSYMDLSD